MISLFMVSSTNHAISYNMTHKQETAIINECISRDGKLAYLRAMNFGGAYTIRGNSIVWTKSDGTNIVLLNINQVKVRVKENEKVLVLD